MVQECYKYVDVTQCLSIKLRLMDTHRSVTAAKEEPEEFRSSLNVNKTDYLKVDPLASIINFQRHRDSNHLLSNWSRKLNSPMSLVSLPLVAV
ncbi:26S proteasome non-ATPase regulatory subunit 12 [Takifugu flavidus]|uniref:26S proteasome non-ATPase regulatory subunit 12 n=1 Tax=Takifugu flavidus TaxID=433684 RepID=A0A5C6MVZ7_9TELE|nr:26S proteasome non-ATPase regulatory subunit 12 [Takifugu flavidus]